MTAQNSQLSNHDSHAPRSVEAIALYRSRRGNRVADRLALAASACGSPVALGVADVMRECSSPVNVWTASDLHTQDGELFDGVGTFASCGSRLCPSCSADLRRRARRRARVALASCVPRDGEHHRLVTLTMPTVAGASLLETMHVIQRAWSLLRKRKFWRETVRAGIKGCEFTVTDNGSYHTHLHCLVVSRWIEHARLRSEWTACVLSAWRARARAVMFGTHHGEAIVDVRLVRAKRGATAMSVTTEGALLEVCKYVTKSESWDAVPDAHLVEIAEVARWPRLFEVFGEMRVSVESDERATDQHASGQTSDARPVLTSLDKKFLSDGSTRYLNDGAQLPLVFVEPTPTGSRARPPTLRALMTCLPRPEWLTMLSHHFADRRAYRIAALCARYPFAKFTTLAGRVTSGVALRCAVS